MKIIDRTPDSANKTSGGAGLAKLQSVLGLSKPTDLDAQEALINRLKKLDSTYTLLRNIQVGETSVPLLLIGPTGIHALYASVAKGVFQAKEDLWREMKSGTKEYTVARPNLVAQTLNLSRAINQYLEENGYEFPEIPAVLVFTDPGAHVESSNAAVRVVQFDGIGRYITSLVQGEQILTAEDVYLLAELFTRPAASTSPEDALRGSSLTEDDEFNALLEPEEGRPEPEKKEPPALVRSIQQAGGKLRLKRDQWIILAGMAGVEALCLMCLILAVVFWE